MEVEERQQVIDDDKWLWKIVDMLRKVRDKGILSRCTNSKCGALNPNPQKTTCWKCEEESLRCPLCNASPYLRYNVDTHTWKCPSAGCGAELQIDPESGTEDEQRTIQRWDIPTQKFRGHINVFSRSQKSNSRRGTAIPIWVIVTLLILALAIIGIGISLGTGTFGPLLENAQNLFSELSRIVVGWAKPQ